MLTAAITSENWADFDYHALNRAIAQSENIISRLDSATDLLAHADELVKEVKEADANGFGRSARWTLCGGMRHAIHSLMEKIEELTLDRALNGLQAFGRIMEGLSDRPLLGADDEGPLFVDAFFDLANLLADNFHRSLKNSECLTAVCRNISHTFAFKGAFSAVAPCTPGEQVIEDFRLQLSALISSVVNQTLDRGENEFPLPHYSEELRVVREFIEVATQARLAEVSPSFGKLVFQLEGQSIYVPDAADDVYVSLLGWIRATLVGGPELGKFLAGSLNRHSHQWDGWLPTLSTLASVSSDHLPLVEIRLMNEVILPIIEGDQKFIVPIIQFMKDGRDQLELVASVLRQLGENSVEEFFVILGTELQQNNMLPMLLDLIKCSKRHYFNVDLEAE